MTDSVLIACRRILGEHMAILCVLIDSNNCFRSHIKYSHRLATCQRGLSASGNFSSTLHIDQASRCCPLVAGLVRDNRCSQRPTPPSLSSRGMCQVSPEMILEDSYASHLPTISFPFC